MHSGKTLHCLDLNKRIVPKLNKDLCEFVTMDGSFKPGASRESLHAIATKIVTGQPVYISHRSLSPSMNSFILDFDCKLQESLDPDTCNQIMEGILQVVLKVFRDVFPELCMRKHALFLLEHPREGLQTFDGKFAFHIKSIRYPKHIQFDKQLEKYMVDSDKFYALNSKLQDEDALLLGDLGGICLSLPELMIILKLIRMEMEQRPLLKDYVPFLDDEIYKGGMKIRMHNACKFPRCKCKKQKEQVRTFCALCNDFGVIQDEQAQRKYRVIKLVDIHGGETIHEALIDMLDMNTNSSLQGTMMNIWMTSPGFQTRQTADNIRACCHHNQMDISGSKLGKVGPVELREQLGFESLATATEEQVALFKSHFEGKDARKKHDITRNMTGGNVRSKSSKETVYLEEGLERKFLAFIRKKMTMPCLRIKSITRFVLEGNNRLYFIALEGPGSQCCPFLRNHVHSNATTYLRAQWIQKKQHVMFTQNCWGTSCKKQRNMSTRQFTLDSREDDLLTALFPRKKKNVQKEKTWMSMKRKINQVDNFMTASLRGNKAKQKKKRGGVGFLNVML